MKNIEIIKQLHIIKNILNKVTRNETVPGCDNQKKTDMTIANYEVIKIIDEKNAKTISEIQNFLSETLASLTQKIKKLEEFGYIIKRKSPKDPRKNILEITQKGYKQIDKIEKKLELVSDKILSKYKNEEKEIFMKILKDIEEKLIKKINK